MISEAGLAVAGGLMVTGAAAVALSGWRRRALAAAGRDGVGDGVLDRSAAAPPQSRGTATSGLVPALAGHPDAGLWAIATAAADSAPESLAVVGPGTRLTAAALRDYATGVALTLRDRALRPGLTVGVAVPPDLEPVVALALFHEGVVAARAAGATAAQLARFDRVATAQPGALRHPRAIDMDATWLARAAGRHADPDPRGFAGTHSLCRVELTARASGRPHAVPLTVAKLLARVDQVERDEIPAWPFLDLRGPGTPAGYLGMLAALTRGRTVLLPGRPLESLQLARDHRVAAITGTPSQLAALLLAWQADPRPLSWLRVVTCAGGAPTELAAQLRDAFGVSVVNLYGSDELGAATRGEPEAVVETALETAEVEDHLDVGTALPGVELEVVDDLGRAVPRGTAGRVRYRRPGQSLTNWYDPWTGADEFRDGWLHPGDRGRLTPDGRLLLAAREG